MDHEARTATITFATVVLTAMLVFTFRAELWAYVGVAWVAPLLVAPFVAPQCKHNARFPLNRARIYALIGALAGYASYFPLFLFLTPLLLGAGVWVAVAISIVVAAGLSAWFAARGCRHYTRLSGG